MSPPKPLFSVVSLGCARTLVDTEKMVDLLQQGGFQLTAEGSGERITILNTCSFIQAAIDETEANIRQLSERKLAGHIKYLVVAGCYPSRFKEPDLQAKFPDVDLWITTKDEMQVQQKLSALVFEKKFRPASASVPYTKLTPSHFAYLKISEGCNNWCSFCTIPKIRGEHTSKTSEEVIKEANLQLSFGAKELIVIAEDTTAWGEDIYGKPSFPMLLKELAKVDVPWIRAMYIFPSRVDAELISVLRDEPKLCRYMDMPIQHVNSMLLEKMNRKHDKVFLTSILDKLFAEIPDFTWRTTFIVGFPGETEEHVQELMDFMSQYPITQLGCFPYSEERETRSARMADKVDPAIIQKRIRRIMKHQYELVTKRHEALIGKTFDMLYEGNGEGRTYREAPDVDGRILVKQSESLVSGNFYPVKITAVKGYDLLATLL
ncbi:MAG: 30S ribosomal protein S12 methylthiotransferase RimO [Candidatus Margulisbacteria bacterium]|nr:30S ribosomal protein S12 methylthiotransferase RimO [Candidatus Margulisiibacteriota bacterium]